MRACFLGATVFFWLMPDSALAFTSNYFGFTTEYPPVYEARGADFVSRLEFFSVFDPPRKVHRFQRRDAEYGIAWNQQNASIEVERGGKILASVPLNPLYAQVQAFLKSSEIRHPRKLPQSLLTLQARNRNTEVTVYFDDVSGELISGKPEWSHFKADVFVKLLSPAR